MGDRWKMNLYNNKISRRTNKWIRQRFIVPKKRKELQREKVSIICNNCIGGFISHDLGLRFDSPTVNMFFHDLDFFDFVEHFDYYIKQPLVQINNPCYDSDAPNYPVAILPGEGLLKNLELHFLHYSSFEEAKQKWESRKKRLDFDNLYVMWTFVGMNYDEELYERAQNLPVKNKVLFVNHPVDKEKYPSFFYIKGFEKQVGLGLISEFMNLKGERYYDQFDYVKWINAN